MCGSSLVCVVKQLRKKIYLRTDIYYSVIWNNPVLIITRLESFNVEHFKMQILKSWNVYVTREFENLEVYTS